MAEKREQKISAGRIVIVTVDFVTKGKDVVAVRRPAIVSQVIPGNEKTEIPEKIKAHVFVDGAKEGDFCCTQFRTCEYDATGKKVGSWAWPGTTSETAEESK